MSPGREGESDREVSNSPYPGHPSRVSQEPSLWTPEPISLRSLAQKETIQLPAQHLRSGWDSGDQICHMHPRELSCGELSCPLSQSPCLDTAQRTHHLPSSPPPIMSLCKSFSVPSVRSAGCLPAMTLPVLPHLSFVELSILILIGTTNDEGVGYAQSTGSHDISKGPFFGPG